MGFFRKLFGGTAETEAQKLARARFHLDEHEPQLAARIVERLTGPEADEIRRRARELADGDDARLATKPARDITPSQADRDDSDESAPAPSDPDRAPGGPKPQRAKADAALFTLGGDGSMRIATGDGGWLTLNAAQSDDDGGMRSRDGLAVARRLITSTGATELDPRAFAFVDAVRLLALAGEPTGEIADPRRRAVAELAREPARVAEIVKGASADVADALAWFATPLCVQFAAPGLAALALERRVAPTPTLIAALVRDDIETCVKIAGADALLHGEARLLAEHAGLDATRFEWRDWRVLADDADANEWRALEIRRLASVDLEAAVALEASHAAEVGTDEVASEAVARALARHDPARLWARLDTVPIADDAGWLAGALGLAGIEAVIDRWIDAIGPSMYDPWAHFAAVLGACIELDDAARVRRCIAAGGPTGWQLAVAARTALARSPHPAAMLAVLYERAPAGIVSSRAVGHGMMPVAAGKVVMQPAWLAFSDPHPVETLAIVAALGPDTPRWSARP